MAILHAIDDVSYGHLQTSAAFPNLSPLDPRNRTLAASAAMSAMGQKAT
jgi:hypothetical protein